MQLLPVPDPQLTMVVEITFTSSNKMTEHADMLLMHLKNLQIATRWWLMRYAFVAHQAGNEIIPSSKGKKRLYYNDSEFTVDDRQTHRQELNRGNYSTSLRAWENKGPDGGLPSPVAPVCLSVCIRIRSDHQSGFPINQS
jgi:hypothetical protein